MKELFRMSLNPLIGLATMILSQIPLQVLLTTNPDKKDIGGDGISNAGDSMRLKRSIIDGQQSERVRSK